MRTVITLSLLFTAHLMLAINPTADSANTDYLKGQARLKRENMQSLVKRSEALVVLYAGYKDKVKNCQGAKPQWKKAMQLAKRAQKYSQQGMKLADKAEKAKKMSTAKKCLDGIDRYQMEAREDCQVSEDRQKEIDFELKGCR